MKNGTYSTAEIDIFGELLRRYICFHYKEDMETINIWGLSKWGQVSKMIKKGLLISDMKRENKIVWYKPNKTVIDEVLKPALNFYLKEHQNPELDDRKHERDYSSYIYLTKYSVD